MKLFSDTVSPHTVEYYPFVLHGGARKGPPWFHRVFPHGGAKNLTVGPMGCQIPKPFEVRCVAGRAHLRAT